MACSPTGALSLTIKELRSSVFTFEMDWGSNCGVGLDSSLESSPRTSHIVKLRTTELGVDIVRQGFEEKLSIAQEVTNELGLTDEQVCYIGDDLPDLPVMRSVGLAIAVADACDEVRAIAHLATKLPGGQGAVREAVEHVLKVKGVWGDLIRKYTGN